MRGQIPSGAGDRTPALTGARAGRRSSRAARIGAIASAIIGAIIGAVVASQAAHAQDIPDSVFSAQDAFERRDIVDVFEPREFPERQPIGYRAGEFLIRPSVEISGVANSNIRARGGDTAGVAGVIVAPTLSVATNTPRYSLNAYVAGTAARYAERSTENVEQVFGGISFMRPFDRTSRISAQVEAGRYVEDRAAAFTPFDARTPIEFDRVSARLEGVATPGRLVINPGFEINRLAYHDNRLASDPSQILVQRIRSLTRINPSLTVGYTLSGDTAFYVGAESNRRNYDIDVGRGRDSRGYAAFVGGRIRPAKLLQVDAAVGYLRQNYRPGLTDPKALYLRVAVDWVPTPLTGIKFDLRRDVSESGALQLGGALRTRARLRLTHELYRDLSVTLGAETTSYAFGALDRQDRRSYLTGEARYYANRQFEVFAAAQQLFSRSGNLPTLAPDFDRTIVRVGVRLKR